MLQRLEHRGAEHRLGGLAHGLEHEAPQTGAEVGTIDPLALGGEEHLPDELMHVAVPVALHLKLAEYLENHMPESRVDVADMLSFHFLAGNDPEKGFGYALLAAMKAREQYANKDAIHYYKKTLEILREADFTVDPELKYQIRRDLGIVYRQAGVYDQAIVQFEDCLKEVLNKEGRMELHYGLGQVYQEQGDTRFAVSHLETALNLAGKRVPPDGLWLLLSTIKELTRRTFVLFFPPARRSSVGSPADNTASRQSSILRVLFKIYFFEDSRRVIWSILAGVNLAERSGLRSELAYAYSNYALLLAIYGFSRRSDFYFLECRRLIERNPDPVAEANYYQRMALRSQYDNNFHSMIRYARRQIALLKEIGEVWDLVSGYVLLASAHLNTSDFSTARNCLLEVRDLTERQKSRLHLGFVQTNLSFCEYMLGIRSADEARPILMEARNVERESQNPSGQALCLGYLTLIAVREGVAEDAVHFSMQAFDLIIEYRMLMPQTLLALVHAAEGALFALHRGEEGGQRQAKLRRIVKKAHRYVLRRSRQAPLLVAQALRIRAGYDAYRGRRRAAQKLYEQALGRTQNKPDAWERGLVYYDRSRYSGDNRAADEAAAREIFQTLGLVPELNRLES